VGHTISLFGVMTWIQPPYVPYMQNVAVLMFFLLSGFLIAHTLASRSANPEYGFRRYFIDRFSRVYSALIPSLIVVAVIDCIWTNATGETRSTFTLKAFLSSVLMLQDVAGPLQRLRGQSFGTAGQLWTLAIEWHIYMLAGALFFIRRSIWMPVIVAIPTEMRHREIARFLASFRLKPTQSVSP
jgi:peptidoglycan/LPS O-acetylase OafA/YrhL